MIPSTLQVLSMFNLVVGLMLVASLLLFLGGFIQYLIRLGTWPTYRTESIRIMEWGVSVLFALIILLAIQQFLVRHLIVAVSIVGMMLVLLIIWLIIAAIGSEKPAAPPREDRRP